MTQTAPKLKVRHCPPSYYYKLLHILKAMNVNYNCTNLQHIFLTKRIVGHIPMNKVSGVVFPPGLNKIIIFTDKLITDSQWMMDNQEYFYGAWTNPEKPVYIVPHIDIVDKEITQGSEIGSDIKAEEDLRIAEAYADAIAHGVNLPQFCRMSGVKKYRVEKVLKKHLTT